MKTTLHSFAGYAHIFALISKYMRSRPGFCRKPCLFLRLLFLSPSSLSSLLSFPFHPSTGNPSWMTHYKHFLLKNANRPAGEQLQWAHTYTTTNTHKYMQWVCVAEFASVILWVTKWSSGDGHGIWKEDVIIFQGILRSPAVATAMSSAHLILETSREGGRQIIKTTQAKQSKWKHWVAAKNQQLDHDLILL